MTQTQIATTALLTAATTAAGVLTYAALSAQSQLFGKLLIASDNPNQIALTYDDGPNDIVTERLLEVLARHQTRATFFLIGRYVEQRPAIARAIATAGHLIGNHTMTHPWLAWQSPARIREELTRCSAAIEDSLGIPVRYFRAPTAPAAPQSSASPTSSASPRSSGTSSRAIGCPSPPARSQTERSVEFSATNAKTVHPISCCTTADRQVSASRVCPASKPHP
ncbi:polysaccharide deacetylase family protein [Tunturiibacter empetritectus]|uniref:polysaccharide deacetylase family protein n=1 Tax=Tunturiibacter empetritectus TaxID=3069691 RepID=UPI003D9B10D1